MIFHMYLGNTIAKACDHIRLVTLSYPALLLWSANLSQVKFSEAKEYQKNSFCPGLKAKKLQAHLVLKLPQRSLINLLKGMNHEKRVLPVLKKRCIVMSIICLLERYKITSIQ